MGVRIGEREAGGAGRDGVVVVEVVGGGVQEVAEGHQIDRLPLFLDGNQMSLNVFSL